MRRIIVSSVIEFIGTFMLVFCGTSVAVHALLALPIAGPAVDSLAVALTFGLVVTGLVYAFNGEFNPVVTLSLAIVGELPWQNVPAHWLFQIGGAVAASNMVSFVLGDKARSIAKLGLTQPALGVSNLQLILIEMLMTFLLVTVIVAVTLSKQAHPAASGIAIGFTLTVGILVAGPISGGALNPARALGPMIVMGTYDVAFAYIVGPFVGGVLGALAGKVLVTQSDSEKG